MKRNERIGIIIKTLTDNPCKIYPLQHFCRIFDAAKSTVSEDVTIASKALKFTGTGYIETIPGTKGGTRFIPDIDELHLHELQETLCKLIQNPDRMLGGGFLYTSDIMYDHNLVRKIASVFAKKFLNAGADYVATVETKGIPIASATAHMLNLPLVIIRREAKISEGSTVSINYFSGSYDRIQKMSIAKRAVTPGSNAIVIDDFMRGGGSTKGIHEILGEFDVNVVGTGIAIAAKEPIDKKINDYTAIVYLGEVNEKEKTIEVIPNNNLF